MEYLGISGNIFAKAESQLQSINLVKWNSNTETEKFWSEVKEIKDASEENSFSEIFLFAKRALILPNSNADVERIFSAMNFIKSKISMKTDLLNAILVIKFGLIRKGKCCMSYNYPIQ